MFRFWCVFIPEMCLEQRCDPTQDACVPLAPLPLLHPVLSHTVCPGAWEEDHTYPKRATPPLDDSFSGVSERLRQLSARSEEALSKLPNQGQPYIGRDGMLREYRGEDTSELPDPGHRHQSGLWALYPGFQVTFGAVLRLTDKAPIIMCNP